MADDQATGGARPFRFGVVAPLRTDLPAWRDQVRRIAAIARAAAEREGHKKLRRKSTYSPDAREHQS